MKKATDTPKDQENKEREEDFEEKKIIVHEASKDPNSQDAITDKNISLKVSDKKEQDDTMTKDKDTQNRDVSNPMYSNKFFINATNTLLTAGQSFPSSNYNTPNVPPTPNSLNSDYSSFDKYKYNDAFNSTSSHLRLKSYDTVRHFYALSLDTNSGGTMPIAPDFPVNSLRTKMCTEFAAPFVNGFNEAYLSIDSNLPGFEVKIDPAKGLGLDFLPYDDILNVIADIQGIQPAINGDTTTFKFWALAMKVISASANLGCFIYYNKPKDDAYAIFDQLAQQTDFIPNLIQNPSIDQCEGNFYTGRYTVNSIPDEAYLKAITGSLPNDDYTRYPRIEYMQNGLPNTWMRVMTSESRTNAVEFGSLTDTVQVINNFKYRELAITGTDVVADTLQRNTLSYIKTTNISIEGYLSLINSMMMRSTDFVGGNFNYQFRQYTAELSATVNETLAEESISYFPGTPHHMFAFKAAEALSPSTLMQVFGSVKEICTNLLSRFEFKSIQDMQSTIVDVNTLNTFPGYTTRIVQLISRMTLTTPSALATKMAIDMMSLYVISSPSRITISYTDVTGSPINFGMDLRALFITFYLTPNYFIRNPTMWLSILHNFFLSYFPIAYGSYFKSFGYGSFGGSRIEVLHGHSRITDDNVTWSLFQNFASEDKLFESLKSLLSIESLSKNKMLTEMSIPESRYRWGRKVRLPGQAYLPYFTDVPNYHYPMTSLLLGLQTHIVKYAGQRTNRGLRINEQKIEDRMVQVMVDFSYQFGSWFHLVYCPSYATVAKSCPMLFRSDYLPAHSYLAMYDEVPDVFPDKSLVLTTPYSLRRNPTGSVISLPIETNVLFTPKTLFEASYLYMCAAPVNTAIHGVSLVHNLMTVVDYSPYQVWFTQEMSTYFLGKYLQELQSRFILYESICMNVELLYGSFLQDSVAWVNESMNKFARANKPTSLGMVYLRKLFGWDFINDNEALSKVNDITAMLLKDARYYCPASVVALTAPVFSPIEDTKLPYTNIVRPYIVANSNLLLDRLFGEQNGVFKVYKGVSISIESLQGPITYTSKHRKMMRLLDYTFRPRATVDGQTMNTTHTHMYTIYHMAGKKRIVDDIIYAATVTEFIENLNSKEFQITKPFLTVRVDHTLVASEYEVYYELYTLGYLSLTIPDIKYTPMHRYVSYNDAIDRSPLSKDEIMKFLTIIPDLSHFTMDYVDTKYTFYSVVPTVSRRNVLPLGDTQVTPEVPVIASGFNSTFDYGQAQLYIDQTIPELCPSTDYDQSMCIVDGEIESTIEHYPYALRTMSTVWFAIPFCPYRTIFTNQPVEFYE